jgi:hypothetical protein
MDIEIRYFDGCPNWQETDARLTRAVEELGLDAEIHRTLIETHEAAERVGFLGSPSVLINGVDPFADPGALVGLSCRVYRTETGLNGSPSQQQLRQALEAAR